MSGSAAATLAGVVSPVVSLYLPSSGELRERRRTEVVGGGTRRKKRHAEARHGGTKTKGRGNGRRRTGGGGWVGREKERRRHGGPTSTFGSFLERSFFPLCPEARKLRDFSNPFEGSAYVHDTHTGAPGSLRRARPPYTGTGTQPRSALSTGPCMCRDAQQGRESLSADTCGLTCYARCSHLLERRGEREKKRRALLRFSPLFTPGGLSAP